MTSRPRVAICYDFDGTLSPGNMQEYGFFSALGKSAKGFWEESKKLVKDVGADPILAYMKLMLERAEEAKIKTRKQDFPEYGKTVEFFPGVEEWFKRINEYGKDRGLEIEHYIVSSGLKEIIEGTSIAKRFKKIYACSFVYNQNDVAVWPAVAVNYTTKTQFLFRINKGIENDSDHTTINQYIPEDDRPIPFSRMIYIGDGETDVPCMKLVKDKRGVSIAIYSTRKPEKRRLAEKLLADGRVNYIARADYSLDSQLDKVVKTVLDGFAAIVKLAKLSPKLKKSHAGEETGKLELKVTKTKSNTSTEGEKEHDKG